MKPFILSISVVLTVLVSSCSKSKATGPNLAGDYGGQIVNGKSSTVVNLQLTAKAYKAVIPASQLVTGNGNYTVSNNQITFRDTAVHNALLPSSVYLNGTYTLTLKCDSLIFTDTNGISYRLKKSPACCAPPPHA